MVNIRGKGMEWGLDMGRGGRDLGQVRSGTGVWAGAACHYVHFPPVLQRPPSGYPPGRCLAHPHLLEMLINML